MNAFFQDWYHLFKEWVCPLNVLLVKEDDLRRLIAVYSCDLILSFHFTCRAATLNLHLMNFLSGKTIRRFIASVVRRFVLVESLASISSPELRGFCVLNFSFKLVCFLLWPRPLLWRSLLEPAAPCILRGILIRCSQCGFQSFELWRCVVVQSVELVWRAAQRGSVLWIAPAEM